jgi:isopentenyldiphosphate isomerase
MELVDIVNADNEIIDTVTRAQMRAGKMAHRACYIAYCDRQDRFLVEVRTLAKDYAPGKLDVCIGGVLQHGEDILEGSKRELLEEVGIDVNSSNLTFEFLGTKKIMYQDGVHFLYAYLYFAKGDVVTCRQKEEVSGIMYLNYEDVLALGDNTTKDALEAFVAIVNRAKERELF